MARSDARRWRAALGAVLLGSACRGEPTVSALPAGTECVVLVHGLGRSAWSMKSLARRLSDEGFAVVNYDYASTEATIASHAADLAQRLPELLPVGITRVDFVTHSMGGIVVRLLLATREVAGLGRVVMLAPPNHGSELADALREVGILEAALGPSAMELGTRDADVPRSLGPVSFECGVIAGDSSLNPFSGLLFDGPNDGKVSVEGTRVEGMADFLVVHHGHTFLMNAEDVQTQVVQFLRSGAFDHARARSSR